MDCYFNNNSDAFVLLACDGVYDVMSNQEIVDLLARNLGFSGTHKTNPKNIPRTVEISTKFNTYQITSTYLTMFCMMHNLKR